jgi:hypothetical protein
VRAIGAWLSTNGLNEISAQERYRAIQCLERREEIEAWRASLDDTKRRTLNHPSAVWHAWRRATRTSSATGSVRRRLHVVTNNRPHKVVRSIHWPGDMLRRAAHAVHDARSADSIILAKAALAAAIRNEVDLLELLPDPRPTRPASKEEAVPTLA